MRIENFRSGEALGNEPRIVYFSPAGASFGRVARSTPVLQARPLSASLSAAAAAERSRAAGDLIADAFTAAVTGVRTLVAAWKRHRQVRATLRALQPLDTRALRDLGLTRGELSSVAYELAGAFDRATAADERRVRAGRAREYFSIV